MIEETSVVACLRLPSYGMQICIVAQAADNPREEVGLFMVVLEVCVTGVRT